MSDNDDEDFNASYEADNPDNTKEISCLNETVVSESSFNDELESSLSFSSTTSEAPLSSTPSKKGTASRTSSRQKKGSKAPPKSKEPFKVPSSPPIYFGKCPRCGRGLKTMTGLNNHILAHEWKDLATKKPSGSAIEKYCHEAHVSVLEAMKSLRKGGKFGTDFNEYVSKIIEKKSSPEWKKLVDAVSSLLSKILNYNNNRKSATFGSALRNHLYCSIGEELSNNEKRDELVDLLLGVEVVIVQVANLFLFRFVQQMGNAALVFVFRSITGRTGKETEGRQCRSQDKFVTPKSQHLVHHIAGACMKSHIRHCYRYPKNGRLRHRKTVILTKFAKSPPTVAEKKDPAYWTAVLNRKSLFFVNSVAFEFFLELAKLLQNMELASGSIEHEAVMNRVIEMPSLLNKWDNIVGCSLNDEESFSFMVKVIRTLTNTYGTGILLRRMNQMWKKGKGNKGSILTSHRAKLLRK